MRHILRHSLLFLLPGIIVLSSFLAILTPAVTYAADDTPQDQLERWLYYRGMRACLSNTIDNVTLSKDEINDGKWKVSGKKGFGLLAPDMDGANDNDGTVNCDDGSIWVRGAKAYGFPDAVHLFCGIASGVTQVTKGDSKLTYSSQNCTDSTRFKLAGLNPSIMQQALTDALDRTKLRPPFNINDNPNHKVMLYLIGARSLETFCGGGVSLKSGVSKQNNDDNRVLVDIANADGTVDENKTYFLKGDRDEDSKVDDIYYNQGGDANNAQDLRCHEMAKMTRDNSASYAAWARENPEDAKKVEKDAEAQSNNPNGNDTTTCAVDNIGWIICPTMQFMANIVEVTYTWVAGLMVVSPISTEGGGKALFTAWSTVRNIANAAFVLGFLIIIYSQITGAGLSNYGIKKMLPRLVVAAVLVNVSYWLCAIAVDISNILGSSFYSLFGGWVDGIDTANIEGVKSSTGEGSAGGWGGLTAMVLAGGVAVYVGLSVLLPAVIAALLAIVTVFLVLTLRQVLIILLIVISPLAFVAFLLPNTSDWFKKWRTLFQTLLLMFPIISIIFGASSLASTIVMASAIDESGEGDFPVQVMGALITIIPLALTPIIMKTAGGVLNRFGGFINNPNKGPFDRMKKGAENVRKNQEGKRTIRALNGGRVIGRGRFERKAKRDAISQGIQSEAGRATSHYVAGEIEGNDNFRNRVAGGSRGTYTPNATEEAMQRALDSAQFTVEKAEVEEVKAAGARIDRATLDLTGLRSVALGGGATGRSGEIEAGDLSAQRAAIQQIVAGGDIQGIRDLIDNAHTFGADEQKVLADSLSAKKPGFVGAGAISDIRQGNQQNTNALVQSAINNGAYSTEVLGKADRDEVALVANNASAPGVTATAKAKLVADAGKASTDPRFSAGKNRANLENVVAGNPGVFS